MRPLIGIPPCLDERGRWRSARDYHYVDAAYARAIDAAGGLPVYLPECADPAAALERLDGLLVPGGDDFPPDRPYPEGVLFDPAPARQRAADRALLEGALGRRLPVLGICYGMQLLALACGGSLHFDIASDLPDAGPHQLDSQARHPVELADTSRLARLLGRRPMVNSRHHQAVADAGRASVVGRARDGVVEALELDGGSFALGVQWHPESLDESHRASLFGALVEAARAGDAAGGRP